MMEGTALWIEYLPGSRAQLHADAHIGDNDALVSWPIGSPAPAEAVEAFAQRNGWTPNA